jgi:hypothetical protein
MSKRKFKILVGIYLNGKSLDPVKLTDLLGVSPSTSKRKGDKRVISTGREVVAKMGQWALMTELDADSFDLPTVLSELGKNIRSFDDGLGSLPGVDNGYVDVFAATIANAEAGATCEFELSQQSVNLLRSLGLPVRFTISVAQPKARNKGSHG